MLSKAPVTTMLPVKDFSRAREVYEKKRGLKTLNRVCVPGAEKAAWFRDTEGNYL
jgi:hypothetical protein